MLMARLNIVLVALVGVLAGGLGTALVSRQAPAAVDPVAVRAIVEDVLAKQDTPKPVTTAAIDQKTLDPMIEKYLMNDPHVLERVSSALDKQNKADQAQQARQAIASNRDAIFNDPDHIVLGNPKGDVTLVEMFDYNCSFCRGALPDMATLLAEDHNLRVVLKEFPILSKESEDAARVAVLVAKAGVDYWTFHQALFTSRGQVNEDTALNEARTLGLNPVTLKLDMQDPSVTAVLQKSYDLATKLNITGTPTYIIGDALIPGAVDIGVLRTSIANMRKCGKTDCSA
jgi:protein-disulfide isomerase